MNWESKLSSVGIIGDSPAMHLLARQIETAASCDLTALVTGESGTGKELVARALHRQSARACMPFISVHCGAITETLMESELFGYERGAFTGAHQRRKGLFEAAHNGTIFLDEIAEMSASQVKLLRVLQEDAVRPVGAHAEIQVDVRVIAATNRNLAREVSAGRFREDLFYRIAVLAINTPPLRARTSDIPVLTQYFQHQAEQKIKSAMPRKVEDDAVDALLNYSWPGNVRQLRHVVEKLVVGTLGGSVINADAVRRALDNHPHVRLCSADGRHRIAAYTESDSLNDFLDRTMLDLYDLLRAKTGSHSQTARQLRIDRVSLYQRLKRARRRLYLSTVNEAVASRL
ncbi:MAG: sigma-54 interaction domain-containing protein [Burkholderiales bacterium]